MKKLSLFLILCLTGVFAHAGITVVNARQKGAYNTTSNPSGIGVGQSTHLRDDQYNYMLANPTTWDDVFTNCKVENRIILRYEESARVYYSTPWSLAAQCTLKKWDATGAAISPDEYFTLTIDYDPAAGTTYIDKDVYVATDPGYRVQLIVGTITPTGAIASSGVPVDVILETEIEVTRAYIFTQTSAPSSITNSGVQFDNTFNIRWDYLPGAESYDLEFLHVSDYDAASIAAPDFTRATRVNTANQNYTLNLAYDDGFILYRIRGVGYDCNSAFRKEGVWSSSSTPVAVNDIDPYRNWQYSSVYAEDGKRKEVISFYDGTGKQRQAVTLSNTENTALVGETMYDYEGRPAIQTLPAPEEGRNSQLMYYQSFSLVTTTNAVYNRKVFDTDDLYNTTNCTLNVTPGMSTDQGASNYYSPYNQDVNSGMYQALPDAQLFPFVQTVYGPDGRPVKQSAPGVDHTIGSDQEVESYYTTPTQERIDRLFGNEVGYAEHYNQVSVVDPNGQMSVSYLDLSGRVIATSLVGEAPANLDPLASNTITTFTESFNNNNVFDVSTGTWLVNAFYMVNTPGDYEFTYEMTPEDYTSICTSQHFDCVYDLEMNIYDGCDNPMDDNFVPPTDPHVLGTPYVITYSPSFSFTKTFTVYFNTPGVYRIEKKLSLNQAALDAAIIAFQAALPGTCFQTLSEITDDLNGAIDSTECQGCDSSCIVKGIALGLEGTVLADFIDSCQTHDCNVSALDTIDCTAMYNTFAGDLTPGGQYFDDVPAGTTGIADDDWMVGYVWGNGASSNWTSADFRDLSNNVITNWTDMRTYWQPGWATQTFTATITGKSKLVEFHPEYCHYTWCTNHYDDQQFDLDLFTSDDDAWASSYPAGTGAAWTFNPAGGNEEGTNMVNADSYFNSSPGSGDKTAMQAWVDVYTGTSSMWTYAGTLAGCTGCDDQWIMFRTLYISKKAEFMKGREGVACGYLCDADVPLDFYADACSGAETDGFMIRIPDLVGSLSTQPSSSWNTNSQTIINCNTAATATIDFYDVNGSDYSSGLIGTVEVLYDDGITSAYDITCGLVVLNGPYTMSTVATLVAAAINSCISVPYDFTAMVDPLDPENVIITGPASAGSSISGDITVNPANGPSGNYKFAGGVTGSGIDCLEKRHCFCDELKLYKQFYLATSVNSPYSGGYIVDHSLHTTVEAYIAYVLNASYGTGVTSAQVNVWMDNCVESSMSDPTDGGTDTLPAALDCENPIIPCMEDAYDITDYYAGVFYQQMIEQATQNFIAEYIQHCFNDSFAENFNVEHEDREYHYTLYYYDQAGNLTRTVPPHATDVLDATETAQVNAFRTAGTGAPEYPNHARSGNNLVTNYKYNSFNNLVNSATPDGGETNYYYDIIGRIVASQNSKQDAMAGNVYSYTFYDAQGRVYEVGQVNCSATITSTVTATQAAFNSYVSGGTRSQVTSTYYDETLDPTTIEAEFFSGQNYLRKRVTSVTIEETFDSDPLTYDHATHFSYDVHGNVNELIQEFPELVDHDQQFKHITYEYDLISGNVNQVIYNQGSGDQYIHHYYYDADNRLTNVYTSIDSIIWEQDAKYFYYLHGPLGRSETGDVKVQGTDYAYTIHGWIKGVNSNVIDRTSDLGKDAQATNNTTYSTRAGMHSNIGQDAFGFTLGYYWDNAGRKDYTPINSAAQTLYNNSYTLTVTGANLFNGNIKEMSTALMMPNGAGLPTAMPLICNHYRYDQLNRITEQTSFTGTSNSTYASLTATGEYDNSFVYDAAGNISLQIRNGTTAAGQSMDVLGYYYYTSAGGTYAIGGPAPTNATNKLAYVDDTGTPGNYSDDLEDQSAGNYTYDAIGNLITDVSEGISNIEWNVYGKIKSVTRTTGNIKNDLNFIYDAFGNRIVKISKERTTSGVKTQDRWTYTYYIRDASGNVMSTYTRTYTDIGGSQVEDKLALDESHLYGGSRLGTKDRTPEALFAKITRNYTGMNGDNSYNVTTVASTVSMTALDLTTPERELGNKQYEFSNHLGNVLVTVNDRKFAKQQGASAVVDYYTADIRSYSDYSAFGVQLAGRHGGNYRYTFNGKEHDEETSTYDYGFRIYNPALARFLSVDPLTTSYPMLTPYQFASDSPIENIDLDGLESTNATASGTLANGIKTQPVDNTSKDPASFPTPNATKEVYYNDGYVIWGDNMNGGNNPLVDEHIAVGTKIRPIDAQEVVGLFNKAYKMAGGPEATKAAEVLAQELAEVGPDPTGTANQVLNEKTNQPYQNPTSEGRPGSMPERMSTITLANGDTKEYWKTTVSNPQPQSAPGAQMEAYWIVAGGEWYFLSSNEDGAEVLGKWDRETGTILLRKTYAGPVTPDVSQPGLSEEKKASENETDSKSSELNSNGGVCKPAFKGVGNAVPKE